MQYHHVTFERKTASEMSLTLYAMIIIAVIIATKWA